MNNWLDKWRGEDREASPERRRMREAIARLEQVRVNTPPPPPETIARLEQVRVNTPPPPPETIARLVLLLDLTGSRRASLTNARTATAAMLETIKAIGAIAVKLIYYRGFSECEAGRWEDDPAEVSRVMQELSCNTGNTQIGRALRFVLGEEEHLAGCVFIGDHCEDNFDELTQLAAKLGQRRIPVFVFHECGDDDIRSIEARPVFQRLAELSGGVYCEFRPDSASTVRELLTGVGAYSAGGVEALKQVPTPQTQAAQQLQQRLLLLPPPKSGLPSKR